MKTEQIIKNENIYEELLYEINYVDIKDDEKYFT